MCSEDSNEKWYGVCAVYKALTPDSPRRRHLWQEVFFPICARDMESATAVARRIAEDKQHEYMSATGELVRWTLQEVGQIKELLSDQIEPGTEVYWRFFERVDKKP